MTSKAEGDEPEFADTRPGEDIPGYVALERRAGLERAFEDGMI